MKIPVSKIPPEGMHFEEIYKPAQLDLNTQEITFKKDLFLAIFCSKVANALTVDTDLKAEYELICARCLEVSTKKIEQKNKLFYSVDPNQAFLDITQDIRDDIILNLPMKPLCVQECKGLCAVCGNNLNLKECKCNAAVKQD